ncbi:MAG: ribosomal protein [Candidatus Midichloriaceae bacterium]|jgi:large subunit ribosomal protein L4|nr:ribosomal protein [Candidatus Midichloriaceae bacterium]
MVETVIKNWDNKEVSKLKLSEEVFAQDIREDILHRVVQWQLSKARSGTHKTKQRNEVSGSTRKIYRQKGTGQARHGSIKAPIFVGGGTTFGPVVRSHEYSLNKKIRILGLKVALSLKCLENSIIVLDSAKLDSYKTSGLSGKLKGLNASSALIVDVELDQNLVNSSANIPYVDVIPLGGLNVYDILRHQTLLISKEAVDAIEKRFAC